MAGPIADGKLCTACGRPGTFSDGHNTCNRCRSLRQTVHQMRPEVRERRNAWARARYASCPEHRERVKAAQRAYKEKRDRMRRINGYQPSVLDRLKVQMAGYRSKLARAEEPKRRAKLRALASACQAEIDRISARQAEPIRGIGA